MSSFPEMHEIKRSCFLSGCQFHEADSNQCVCRQNIRYTPDLGAFAPCSKPSAPSFVTGMVIEERTIVSRELHLKQPLTGGEYKQVCSTADDAIASHEDIKTALEQAGFAVVCLHEKSPRTFYDVTTCNYFKEETDNET